MSSQAHWFLKQPLRERGSIPRSESRRPSHPCRAAEGAGSFSHLFLEDGVHVRLRAEAGTLGHHLAQGWVQLICLDSVDAESWYANWAHPRGRLARQTDLQFVVQSPQLGTAHALQQAEPALLGRTGTLVLLTPDWAHACNPIDDRPWAYLMLYVDTDWLTELRYRAGLLEAPHWQDIATAVISDPAWYEGYRRMTACLLEPNRDLLDKQTEVVEYLLALMHELAGQVAQPLRKAPNMLQEVAAYLDEHATEEVSLDTLCDRTGYSPGHLIRAFKQHFGFTPHAYLINRRIQLGQRELKGGTPIVEAALSAGFADQPHFQRTFKRLVAATPNQYRRSSLEQ